MADVIKLPRRNIIPASNTAMKSSEIESTIVSQELYFRNLVLYMSAATEFLELLSSGAKARPGIAAANQETCGLTQSFK